jgi:hypothetical protein
MRGAVLGLRVWKKAREKEGVFRGIWKEGKEKS